MQRKSAAILTLLFLGLAGIHAADSMRPKMELTPTAAGIHIVLDFQDIHADQWQAMLEQPDVFHEFGYGVTGNSGEAALPMITEMIPVQSVTSGQITNLQRLGLALNSDELKTVPAGHLDSDPQRVLVSAYDWQTQVRQQQPLVDVGTVIDMGGQLYLPLTIRPVTLERSTRRINIPRTISFDLTGISAAATELVTEDGGIRSISQPGAQFALKGHYLIITPPVFEPYIHYFADWKLRSGFQVTIVSTATTGQTAAGIKAYVQNAWDTWDSGPDYLVLVGDEDQGIPGFYIQNPQGENLVTDHPYALLEGDDTFPELLVGRLSVDTISELVSFTSKIVAYESSPAMADSTWFTKALMISTTWSAASCQTTKEWVADKLYEHGFSEVFTAYHPQQSSTSYITNPINNGVGFVNYRGFGMYSGWAGPDFTSYNIYNDIANGAKTPVITSVVCGGGNFAANEDPCFGEVWTRAGTYAVPKGAVAFFGPSELHTHTQFNNVIDTGIYSGIFDLGITTLGAALWQGKFELWRNYHDNSYYPFGQTPEFYHYIYNLLGDPGMQLWTDTPRALIVSHPDTLSSGDNSLVVNVTDAAGVPQSQAYVALYNAENALGGYTNAAGDIVLPFIAGTAADLELTVTGRNLLPYLVNLPVSTSSHPLSLVSWDLASGSELISGDTCQTNLVLQNNGAALSDLVLSLTTTTPGITVPPTINLANVPAASILDSIPIMITAAAGLPHGLPVSITLTVTAAGEIWTWSQQFNVQASLVIIDDLSVLSGSFLAGDSAEVELILNNQGGTTTGLLTIYPQAQDLISFSVDSLVCPAIPMDASATAEGSFTVAISDQVFPGEQLDLDFICWQAGVLDTLHYTMQCGNPNRYGPSQADAYGYRMFDNYDLSYSKAQTYDWVEIAPASGGGGTLISMSDTYEEGDASRVVDLPFTVSYYGQNYNQITVCTNGWAAFGNQSVVNFHNRIIPSPLGPTAMLAPYWDDLVTPGGSISRMTTADGDRFIIEWSHLKNLGYQSDLSFQIILFNTEDYPTGTGDNDLKFQYQSYENVDLTGNFSTIGIESPDYQTGVLASYNNSDDPSLGELGTHTTLLFTTDRGVRLADAQAAITSTALAFNLNPWSTATDSIVITNVGETPLAYNISPAQDQLLLPPAPADYDPSLTKSSPDVVQAATALREGSDAFGYEWHMSGEVDGPEYQWVDIESPENLLPYTGDPDDGSIGPVTPGFDFPLYDHVYSEMYIGSNGTITFESVYSPWQNLSLPNQSAPASILAPWWEDLNNDTGPEGTLYFWTNSTDKCIITWQDFPKWGTSDVYTFQVILDTFGKIIYQYQTLNGPTTSVTIGLQNSDRNIGLQIMYNESTVFNPGTAISITRPVQWFAASGWSGEIAPGDAATFAVQIQTQNLDPGHYEVPLTLTSSAINLQEAQLNVGLDVVLGQPPYGDVNHDYLININDLAVLLDYVLDIESMDAEQFTLADLSGDEAVDVIDVILLLETILDEN